MMLLLLLTGSLHAADVWKIGDKVLPLQACPAKQCLYHCPVEKDCQALQVFRAPVKAKDSEGGKNPGSGACRELGGEVSVAEDPQKNQTGLCRFSDGSLLSLDGVWVW